MLRQIPSQNYPYKRHPITFPRIPVDNISDINDSVTQLEAKVAEQNGLVELDDTDIFPDIPTTDTRPSEPPSEPTQQTQPEGEVDEDQGDEDAEGEEDEEDGEGEGEGEESEDVRYSSFVPSFLLKETVQDIEFIMEPQSRSLDLR